MTEPVLEFIDVVKTFGEGATAVPPFKSSCAIKCRPSFDPGS